MTRLIAVVMFFVLLLTGVSSASAGPPIPLSSYIDMAVDEERGNVYLTSGDSSETITVLNLDGTPKSTIAVGGPAFEITLARDRSQVLVALPDQRAIGVINPVTLEVMEIDLGTDTCPVSIAEAGNILWFATRACGDAGSHLGSYNRMSGVINRNLFENVHRVVGVIEANRLLVRVGIAMYLLDTSRGPGLPPSILTFGGFDGMVDPTVSPDGSEYLVDSYPGDTCLFVSLSTLVDSSPRQSYVCGAEPRASAIRADGLIALASNRGDHLRFYEAGDPNLWRSIRFPDAMSGPSNIPRLGIEFGSDALYVVRRISATAVTLTRVPPRRLSSVAVRAGKPEYEFGATATVIAQLNVGSAGGTVSIFAQPYGGARILLKSAPVDGSGRLTATTKVLRNTTFTATYGGDGTFDRSQATTLARVKVRVTTRITRVVGRAGVYQLVRSGSEPRAISSVAPNHAGQCARMQVQEPYRLGWGYTWNSRCTTLTSASQMYIWFNNTWTPGSRARVRLIWPGDRENGLTRSEWVYVRFVR